MAKRSTAANDVVATIATHVAVRRNAAIATSAAATVSETSKRIQKVKKSKAARKLNTPLFGSNAPNAQLRMPPHANIIAAELIVFLPNWLRSYDVIFRFAQNGMDTAMLVNILNYHRTSTKGYAMLNNSLCKIMQNTMRDNGYDGWTIMKHKAGDYRNAKEVWNKENLELTGFRTAPRGV